jgi:hypothetical protein
VGWNKFNEGLGNGDWNTKYLNFLIDYIFNGMAEKGEKEEEETKKEKW